MTAWREDRLELVIDPVRVQFDDLVQAVGDDESLIGGRDRHLRHNVGVICAFRMTRTSAEASTLFLVANAHLYWSPVCEDVKLLQTRHLLRTVDLVGKQLASLGLCHDEQISRFICGDFNSKTSSIVTKYLLTGSLPAAKMVTGFALDDNLYQLTRWLRMLGIDCVVFSLQGMLRGKDASARKNMFETWNSEGRVLVTVSRQLTLRRGAPTSLVIQSNRSSSLEIEFMRLVRRFGSKLFTQKKNFYGRCVKCNAPILPISRECIPTESVGPGRNVPSFVFESDEPLFMCGGGGEIGARTEPEDSKKSADLPEELAPARRSGVRANGGVVQYSKVETVRAAATGSTADLVPRQNTQTHSGCGQVYWWGKGADGTTTTVNRAINLVERLQELVSKAGADTPSQSKTTRKKKKTRTIVYCVRHVGVRDEIAWPLGCPLETHEQLVKRADRFVQWLRARPEIYIAVFAHTSILQHLLGTDAELPHGGAPLKWVLESEEHDKGTAMSDAAQKFIKKNALETREKSSNQTTTESTLSHRANEHALGLECEESAQRIKLFLASNGASSSFTPSDSLSPSNNAYGDSTSPLHSTDMTLSLEAALGVIQEIMLSGKHGDASAFERKSQIFQSAYDVNDPHHVTNKTPTFVDVLDYIFYAGSGSGALQLVKARPVRSALKDADASIGIADIPDLPYQHWPSDHLLLSCDFLIS
eukprot:g1104.t1